MRIELPRAAMRSDRRLEEPAIPARVHEAGVEVRISAPLTRSPHEPEHRLLAAPQIGLEIGVEMVRDRQGWGQFGGLSERDLPAAGIVTHPLPRRRPALPAQ